MKGLPSGYPGRTMALLRRSNVQPDPVQIRNAAAPPPKAVAPLGGHDQALQAETDAHPGVGDPPGVIQGVRPHGRGPDFEFSGPDTTSMVSP